ncbi:MAG: hypothetical protein canaca05_03580 [Anaerolineaceae bacterium]
MPVQRAHKGICRPYTKKEWAGSWWQTAEPTAMSLFQKPGEVKMRKTTASVVDAAASTKVQARSDLRKDFGLLSSGWAAGNCERS